MKNTIYILLAALFLSSCAAIKEELQTPEPGKAEKSKIVLPFKQLRSFSSDFVTAVKDFEGKIWIVQKSAVYSYEEGKLVEAGLKGRYKGYAVNALGTTKGFYVFYKEKGIDDNGTNSYYQKETAGSVKYYNGSRYVEVFKGPCDPYNCFVDTKGRLWITRKENKLTIINGTDGFEFEYKTKLYTGTNKGQKSQEKLPFNFYEDTKGRIWIWSDYYKRNKWEDTEYMDGFICFDNGELYSVPLKEKSDDKVAGILELPSGEYLISFYNAGSWLAEYKKTESGVSLTLKDSTLTALKDFVITDSLLTADGRLVILAGNKKGLYTYLTEYSLFTISEGKTTLLKKSIDGERQLRYNGIRNRNKELCEDSAGVVWIVGERFQLLKVQKDGSIKEYDWTDGLNKPRIENVFTSKNLVFIFAAENSTHQGYVYDNKIDPSSYSTGWEHFNTLCPPLIDRNGGVWFVGDDLFLYKYKPEGSEKALDLTKELKYISQTDRFGSPGFLGICNGLDNDIWLLIGSIDIWSVKYKEGKAAECKLKEVLKQAAIDKNYDKLDLDRINILKTVFSPEGYAVMADSHSNRKTYFFNKTSWELLESADINGKTGLTVSDPVLFDESSIGISLQDRKNNNAEEYYLLSKGKWEKTDKKFKTKYTVDYGYNRQETIVESKEGASLKISDGEIYLKTDGFNGHIPVKTALNIRRGFISGEAIWLTLPEVSWVFKRDYLTNNATYPVYRCAYRQFGQEEKEEIISDSTAVVSTADKQESKETRKGKEPHIYPKKAEVSSVKKPETEDTALPVINIETEEAAFKYILTGSAEEMKEGERYLKSRGEKGREFLKKQLQKEQDEKNRWIIEVLLSK